MAIAMAEIGLVGDYLGRRDFRHQLTVIRYVQRIAANPLIECGDTQHDHSNACYAADTLRPLANRGKTMGIGIGKPAKT